ncbi:nucleotidyltransferase domain-containing protein [Granulicella mallensis]|uniref:Putative nucleotidyltransferase n=1 Tax=Granulicella mallensis TaxID=940614 RepID=A0A7W7ZP38_9BACT|nr:nucleotidyltransferase domain-containing protein [Granulicella mallensis]MBB5063117.1 putative nucleotidyltransferase [Granulicella mallensis]
MDSTEWLKEILKTRSETLSPEIRRRLDAAHEIVIFGSFAAHLQHAESDLDVFCVGESRTHFKSPLIELMILPEHDVFSEIWLGSELANHISNFGIPLGSHPDWFSLTRVGPLSVTRKEKRISAYVRSLERHWGLLSDQAKLHYGVKIRRELQRLQFLQNGQAVPPTKLLDIAFASRAGGGFDSLQCVSGPLQKKILAFFPLSFMP